eukprot:3795657-Amphidinium_carterae.1
MRELEAHVQAGHTTKSILCRTCLLADGPVRRHMVRAKRGFVLHIDLCGPFPLSWSGSKYILVAALRLPDMPLLLAARPTKTKTALEV